MKDEENKQHGSTCCFKLQPEDDEVRGQKRWAVMLHSVHTSVNYIMYTMCIHEFISLSLCITVHISFIAAIFGNNKNMPIM